MKREEFLSYPWHDTEMLSIVIDRRQPGDKDKVEISLRWPDDGSYALLCFTDCYAAELQMNFGVVATESIRSVDYVVDRQDIAEIKKRWASSGAETHGLVCFEIETNSTASILRIYAMDCSITAIQN